MNSTNHVAVGRYRTAIQSSPLRERQRSEEKSSKLISLID